MDMAEQGQLVVPNHLVLQSPIDLSDLSMEQRASLVVSVGQFRLARERVGHDLAIMSQQLANMSRILGSRFMRFATEELGLNERTTRRYLKAHKTLSAHFTDGEGRIDAVYATQVTQNALALLGPETDNDVIDEIKTIVGSGQSVNEDTVRQLIASREKELEADLAVSKAEAQAANRKLLQVAERAEIEQSRLRRNLDGLEEQVRRLEAQSKAANDEVDRLQALAIQVVEKEIEVPPKEYTSTVDAVAAAKRDLADANQSKKRVEEDLASARQELESINSQLSSKQSQIDHLTRLKQHVDAIAVQFPATLLKSLTAADSSVKDAVAEIGDALMLMGKQLKGA